MTTIFEDFIEYCKEDNKELSENIKTWLADFFDLPNRLTLLSEAEEIWIANNLSDKNQEEILGYNLKDFNSLFEDKDELTEIVKEKLKKIKEKNE